MTDELGNADPVAGAEADVLATCLKSPDQMAAVADRLTVDKLSTVAHQVLWRTMLDLRAAGHPVEATAVELAVGAQDRKLAIPTLTDLVLRPPVADAMYYVAEHILPAAAKRRLAALGETARQISSGPTTGAADVAALIHRFTDDVADLGTLTPATGLAARVLTRSQLRTLPSPQSLIADTIDLATVVVVAGWWGTCKSFVALDWACSIGTGHRWHGRPVDRRRVLFIAGEGSYGIDQRVAAWETARSQQVDDDDLRVLPVAVNLGTPSQVAEVCRIVTRGGFGTVFVDTVAKCAVGLDENSAQDMGRVVDSLYRIREATGDGTVVAVHHTGKDKTTVRGSSAIESGVDTVYMTEGEPKALSLSRTKRKDGPVEDTLSLSLEPVEGTESAILDVRGLADITGRARDLMSAFMSAFSVTGATKADLRAVADMAPATFARSLNTLISTGVLINDGTPQRPFYRVVT